MKMRILLISSLIAMVTGCASIPAGWINENGVYTQVSTGLNFPEKTSSMQVESLMGRTAVTNSDAIHYKEVDGGITVSLYVRSPDDVSYEEYFEYSKIALVKEQGLKTKLPSETLSIIHNGIKYEGQVFRGYGKVIEFRGMDVTILSSYTTFDLGDYYLKVRSSGVHELANTEKLNLIRAKEKELLSEIFEKVN